MFEPAATRWSAGSYLIAYSDTNQTPGLKPSSVAVSFVFLYVGKVLVLGHRKFDEKGCADGDPWWRRLSSDRLLAGDIQTSS